MTDAELKEYIRQANKGKHGGGGSARVFGGLVSAAILLCLVAGIFALIFVPLYRSQTKKAQAEEAERQAREDRRFAAQQQDRQREEREKNRPIVIKGLYIGMDSQDVPAAVAQKFGAGWKLNKVGQGYNITTAGLEKLADMYIKGEIGKPENYKFDSWVEVHVDGADKVSGIVIGHNCSLELFGNPNLTQQEYARMLCNAYHIPTLTGERGGWSYTSPDNVQVKVTDEREIEIWKGANVKDAQKAFN